jgi:glycosyltransferase involved in cell wall biosynthesis
VRLLIASGIAAPDIGGPATFLRGVVPALVARGHHVRVLAFGDPDPARVADGLDTRIPRLGAGRWLAYARAARRLAAGADVVLALGLLLPRATPRRVPVVIKVPGDYAWERARVRGWIAAGESLETFDARRHAWRVEILKTLRRREARRATRVIAPSAFVAGLVRGWGVRDERVVVLPNAVPPAGGAAPADRAASRAAFGWRPDEPVLLVAGRLVPWKQVDLVIDAAADAGTARLVVAGDGPARDGLAARAASRGARVDFTGTLAPAALAARLAAADYLVVASSYEGLSHTILEALHAGTPVIASRRGGNPDVIAHGVNGLLVDGPDRKTLAAAIREATAPGRRAQLAAGTGAGLARFDHRGMVDALLATLEDAVAEAARGAGR